MGLSWTSRNIVVSMRKQSLPLWERASEVKSSHKYVISNLLCRMKEKYRQSSIYSRGIWSVWAVREGFPEEE